MIRWKQVLIAIDQLTNTVFGGMADETISARCWRLRHKRGWGIMRRLVDALFFWERDHCYQSYLHEFERRQLPSEYSDGQHFSGTA